MLILTDIFNIDLGDEKKNIISLGKFDGVHRGHQKLFETMRSRRTEGQRIIAFTFDLGMRGVLKGTKTLSIFDRDEKAALLEAQGVDILIECPFTDEVRTMSPESFIKDILVKRLNAGLIVIGEDFCFGYERKGNAKMIADMADEYKYEYLKIEKLKDHDEEISATLIRSELEAGNIERANELLGFPYHINGIVSHGAEIGRTMGFPTVNQPVPDEKLLPPYGVYAARIWVYDRFYNAVTNIGIKPTVTDLRKPIVESHLLDYQGDLYGVDIRTEIYKFMRPEMRFNGLDELAAQIKRDKDNTRSFLEAFS